MDADKKESILLDLDKMMLAFFSAEKYISRREYIEKLSGLDTTFFKDEERYSKSSFETIRKNLNKNYVEKTLETEKEYLDGILKDVDESITIDDDQRRAVITDEDYNLIIAGAGTGKTTTIAAKAKYLVDKQGVDARDILVISYTNKAVEELEERINTKLNVDCIISTFHKLGKDISNEQKSVLDNEKLSEIVDTYFKEEVLKDEKKIEDLILFFASYFNGDKNEDPKNIVAFFNSMKNGDFETLKSYVDVEKEMKKAKNRTRSIQNEVLRSKEEVSIANFLWTNSIEYEYEKIYEPAPYIRGSRKPYTPDFTISQNGRMAYIEHFGISESLERSDWDDNELERYKKERKDKIYHHKKYNTHLIQTFSKYNDEGSTLEHLEDELKKLGFEFRKRDYREKLEAIINIKESRYVNKIEKLVSDFIKNFKECGYGEKDFDKWIQEAPSENPRNKLFLEICKGCYRYYEEQLNLMNGIDFTDMINDAITVLRNNGNNIPRYKYIIVDEYQDISKQRFTLLEELRKVADAKVIAVGDDWQSIFGFSGSKVGLFTKFEEIVGYAEELKIRTTYRNSQGIIDVAGGFIEENKDQIKKDLKAFKKPIDQPIHIYPYKEESNDEDKSRALNEAIKQIEIFNKKENDSSGSILFLGRYNNDNKILKQVDEKYKKQFLTIHKSKGLGDDNVVLLNGKNAEFGFPSKIEDDPVMKYVLKEDKESIDRSEERRLFYVALTRTKNRVFILADRDNPSEFLLEIAKNYPDKVIVHGKWNEVIQEPKVDCCPICGYPLQKRYKESMGLELYICTNEPEICDFMTNDPKGGDLYVRKCDCEDGYLIVKSDENNDYFLGCTTYKEDGSGCNITMSKDLLELESDIYTIIDSLVRVNGNEKGIKYGYTKFIEFLLGEENEKIIKTKLNTIDGFGSFKGRNRFEVEAIVSVMIGEHFIKQTTILDKFEVLLASEFTGKIDVERLKKIQGYIKRRSRELAKNYCKKIVQSCLRNLNANTETRYDKTMLINVLKGNVSGNIRDKNLNKIKEFGALKRFGKQEIKGIIDELIKMKRIIIKKKQTKSGIELRLLELNPNYKYNKK